MKHFNRSLILLMFLAMVFAFAGCDVKTDDITDDETANDNIQIGMSFDSFVIERWTKDREIFVSTASGLGADVNVQNANGSLDTQIEQIRYLIKKNVDALVIIATDSEALSDVVKEAKDAGIPVVAYDRMINLADIDLYISFNNEKVGELMAQALMEATDSSGKYIMLTGPTTDNNVKLIEEGFKKTINGFPIEIADIFNCEGWKPENAYAYLESHPEVLNGVNGIMCGNDSIATQVTKYLTENSLVGSIPIVAQDAELEACQRIVEGSQSMTVYKPVEQLASFSANIAVYLGTRRREGQIIDSSNIRGIIYEMVEGEKSTSLPTIGGKNCPYIMLEPIAVNASNIDDTVIKSGFHLKDEVYMNVKK